MEKCFNFHCSIKKIPNVEEDAKETTIRLITKSTRIKDLADIQKEWNEEEERL